MADRARTLLVKFLGDSSSLDKETNGIVGRLGKIKTAVGEADGFFGKLKAGGGAALESVGGAGVVAGAGITAAAVAAGKGLMDFEKLGVEVGKGADATGLSYEAFSRWKEVADDAGVSGETLEGTVGKFNKTIGASPGLLATYGVEIGKAKDGTVDVNQTFLNAIDAVNGIEDPTKRAEAAARLFGRGWQGMAELIARGAPGLRADLAAVDDSKVFDQGKVDDARRLREAFDSIKDAADELFLTIGEALAPVVADLAPKLAEAVEQVKPLAQGLGDLLSGVLKLAEPLTDLTNALGGPLLGALGKVMGGIGDVIGKFGGLVDSITGGDPKVLKLTDDVLAHQVAQQLQEQAIKDSNDAFDDGAAKAEYYDSRVAAAKDTTLEMVAAAQALNDELADQSSWLATEQAVDDYKAKLAAGNLTLREKQQALIEVKQKLLDFTTSLEDVPAEKQTEIIALIDQGKIDEAEAALANLTRQRNVPINPTSGGAMVVVPKFDDGGVMPGPTGKHSLALVAGGETVLPTHKGPVSGVGGGLTVHVHGNIVGDDGVRQLFSDLWAEMQRQARGNR